MMSGEGLRVALLTGATGFIGGEVTKRLLAKDWHVIIVIRPKVKSLMGKNVVNMTLSSAQRLQELVHALGLSREEASRLYYLEADLGQMMDAERFFLELKKILVDEIGSRRLDVVIHSAASLAQESPSMPTEKQARIRQRNLHTNVEGITNLLQVIDKFGCPEKVRIIRPSIVCGMDSTTGFMAFLNYFGKRTFGIRNHKLLGPVLRFQKILPFFGNPNAIIDIIDVDEVVGAMLGFVDLDFTTQSDKSPSPSHEGLSMGALHYVSTAYVHGKRTGILMEEDVNSKPDQEYNNSYEESKGLGEAKVKLWFKKCMEENSRNVDQEMLKKQIANSFGYYNVTNEQAPTLRELTEGVFKTLGWSMKVNEKIVYCKSQEELESVLGTMRIKCIANLWRIYWKRVEVLYPYLLRETGTKFDCSNTKAALPNFMTRGLRRYFSFQNVSFNASKKSNGIKKWFQ